MPDTTPLAISFWLWNYFYGIKEGEYFHDLEACFRELTARGFNAVRVDAGTGLCHTAEGVRRGEITLYEPFPGYSELRQMDLRREATTPGGCRVDVLEKLIELFTLARQYDVRVILSSWFYLHTFWFVDAALIDEFFALPVEERFMRFAVDTDRILQELKARGLAAPIAFVEIFNEFDSLPHYWRLHRAGESEAERRQTQHTFRRWHEEALDYLQARHPDLRFAIDTCYAGVPREILPRNAHVWNHHMYFAWGVYTDVFEDPVYRDGFDFARAHDDPVVGPFLRHPLVPIEAVRASRSHLEHVEQSWPTRVWLYNNLDPAALPALEAQLTARLARDFDRYRQRIDDLFRQARETCDALFPDIALVVGEGVTYCGSRAMRWEERSEAYWTLVDAFIDRVRAEGYLGCVARTNSGPEDPVWQECPARLQRATARIRARAVPHDGSC